MVKCCMLSICMFNLQVQKLTSSLQKLQNASKDTRDALTAEVAERHDSLLKFKQDVKELEDKHREALATANHRGEVIKQLRDEIQTAENRVTILAAMFIFVCAAHNAN